MMNNNLLVFISLVLLTMGSFFFSEQSEEVSNVKLLLLFASIKVFLVAFYFMELKKAHLGWIIIACLILIVFSGFIIVS